MTWRIAPQSRVVEAARSRPNFRVGGYGLRAPCLHKANPTPQKPNLPFLHGAGRPPPSMHTVAKHKQAQTFEAMSCNHRSNFRKAANKKRQRKRSRAAVHDWAHLNADACAGRTAPARMMCSGTRVSAINPGSFGVLPQNKFRMCDQLAGIFRSGCKEIIVSAPRQTHYPSCAAGRVYL